MRFIIGCLLLLFANMSITAQESPIRIVASYSILGDVVQNVVGDVTDVQVIMPAGADPHSFEPVPSDLIALADADVVFINGAFFEEGLLEAIETADDNMNIVVASSCVEMLSFDAASHDEEHSEHDEEHEHEEDEEHDDEEDGHDEEHEHEEGEEHDEDNEMSAMAVLCEQHEAEMEALHEDAEEDEAHNHGDIETLGHLYEADCGEEGHGHEGEEDADEHEHGACDPHVWMNPDNVMLWTMFIRDTLIDLDPANADTYSANTMSYISEIDELLHDFMLPMLETVPEENRILITSHDSLGYFAATFDFEIETTIIPGGSTLAEPSSADIAAVIDLINEEAVPAIFGETTVPDDIAQQIADETEAELFVLYSGALSENDGPASTYLDYMRYNVSTIVEALTNN